MADDQFEELTTLLPGIERSTLHDIYIHSNKDINMILDTFLPQENQDILVSTSSDQNEDLSNILDQFTEEEINERESNIPTTPEQSEDEEEVNEEAQQRVQEEENDDDGDDNENVNSYILEDERATAPEEEESVAQQEENDENFDYYSAEDEPPEGASSHEVINEALLATLISEGESGKHTNETEEQKTEQFLNDELIASSLAKEDQEDEFNDILQLVLSYAPDELVIDTEYLKERCSEICDDETKIQDFIKEVTEGDTTNYKEYLLRKKYFSTLNDRMQKITLSKFIEKYPNPSEYFRNKKPSEYEKLHAFGFLQRRYRLIDDTDLEDTYERNNCNLTATCLELDSWSMPTRLGRKDSECQIFPEMEMDFIYEVYFIENKMKITEYTELESHKQVIYERAKLTEPTVECAICCTDELFIEEMGCCEEAHIFCKNCIKRQAEIKIAEGITELKCLTEDCNAKIPMCTLENLLHPTLYRRLEQQVSTETVRLAQIEDLESCPFCDYLLIIPQEIGIFACGNPECMKKSCRYCKEPDHTPLRCEEVEKEAETSMRTQIEDKMTEALVRTCNRCKREYVKSDGCNKIVCQCGEKMCYICRKTVKDYTHFNGMGGKEYHKCPLFTNDEEMNEKDVKNAGEKAKAEVTARNVGFKLKHDPTKL